VGWDHDARTQIHLYMLPVQKKIKNDNDNNKANQQKHSRPAHAHNGHATTLFPPSPSIFSIKQ
jgi:hypothetical protein